MQREVMPDTLGEAVIVNLVVVELSRPFPPNVTGLVLAESVIDKLEYADWLRKTVVTGHVFPMPVDQPLSQLLPVALHMET